MIQRFLAAILCAAPFAVLAGSGMSEEGDRLSAAITEQLVQAQLCRDFATCHRAAPIYRRDGKTIELNLYSATNTDIVRTVFGFVAANGLRITGGKPVIVSAFPKPKEAYVNSLGGFIANRKPSIQLRLRNE